MGDGLEPALPLLDAHDRALVLVLALADEREAGLLEDPAARRAVERGVGDESLDPGDLARTGDSARTASVAYPRPQDDVTTA